MLRSFTASQRLVPYGQNEILKEKPTKESGRGNREVLRVKTVKSTTL